MNVAKRRQEILKLEGMGCSQEEILNQLNEKNGCSERTIYNDFETRKNWQPSLQCVTKPDDVIYKVTNRYEQLYRQASFRMLHSTNPSVQLGALNVMVKINTKMYETLVLPDIISRLKTLEEKAAKGVFVP